MLCRSVLTAIAISYILCVLLMSGLQKEDISANTLKKLERHNVNIHDMNNATLRQECLGQTKEVVEGDGQQTEILKVVDLAVTDKSHDVTVDTQTLDTTDTPVHTRYADQDEDTNKKNQLQKYDEKVNNVSETGNKEKKNKIPTLEKAIHFWDKLNNNTKDIIHKALTDVSTTAPATTEMISHPNTQILHSSEIQYIKKMIGGYLASQNVTTAESNTTKRQDTGSESQKNPKDIENNEKFQGSSGIKTTVNNQIVTPLPYNMGEQVTGDRPTLDESQQPQRTVNNADVINLKGQSADTEPRNIFFNQNILDEQLTNEPISLKESNQDDINMENIMKNIVSHNNKRELNDIFFQKTNQQVSGAAASEFYPRIIATGQSSHNNERDITDVPLLLDQPQVSNNIFLRKSKGAQTIAKLEDWYSNFFKNNILMSLGAKNNQKEFSFDYTSTFNYDKIQAEKSKEMQYLGYSPIRGTYKPLQIVPLVHCIEPDNNIFDINALLNNNFKERCYDEENLSAINPKQIITNHRKVVDGTSFLGNDAKYEDFNSNLQKNQQGSNNVGNNLGNNPLENNDYQQFEEVIDAASKPTPENFIGSFRKQQPKDQGNKKTFLKNNYDYNDTSKETEYDQLFKPHGNKGNLGYDEQVEFPKIIPPFLENMLKPKSNNLKNLITFNKPNALYIRNDDQDTADIPASKDDSSTNNKNTTLENSQNMQYTPKTAPNTLIKGDQLTLIKNSLQYINKILAMNEGLNSSSVSYIENTTRDNINVRQNKTPIKNIIKQRKSKNITQKTMIQSNNDMEKSLKRITGIPADLIKEIAESVKKIILKDIKKEITTETPANPTTSLATTITTARTTITTAEKTTVATEIQQEPQTKDANYVVQKILELFKELKTETAGTTLTTVKPTKLSEAYVTKYVYAPSKNNQPLPMPGFNPYGVKAETVEANFTNPYNQMYLYLNKSNKDSSQIQTLKQTSQMINQPPPMLNHPQQITHQSPPILSHQIYNQPLLSSPQQIMLNHLPQDFHQASQMNHGLQNNGPPQVTQQAPQTIYHYPRMLIQAAPQMLYEPVQMMNQPPLMTNQALQNIYHFPQVLNHDVDTLSPPSQMRNHGSQMITLQNSPQMSNQPRQIINNAQTLNQPQQMRNQAPQTLKNSQEMLNQPIQMLNQPQQIMNRVVEILNQPQQRRDQAPQTLNNSPEMLNPPSPILNQAPPTIKDTQPVNRSPEMWNQPSNNMNHAQQILNQALQMKTQLSQMTNDSPEGSNQASQIENNPKKVGPQMRNQALKMMDNYPEILNPPQQKPNRSPQMMNQAPPMIQQSVETKDAAPFKTVPLTNAFQSPYLFQTNLNEIPPLGIPMENQRRPINQVIILTTKGPFQKPKDVEKQRGTNKKLKPRPQKKTRSDTANKQRETNSIKHRETKEPSSKHRVNEFYNNYSGNNREPFKPRYNKQSDYERGRPRPGVVVKKFHEQLERSEDWSQSDRKRSRDRVTEPRDEAERDVASRQQVPLTKIKQRPRYDDTHFRNFLKTQEKVNNMLEAILATKKTGRPNSVEIP